LLDGLSAAADEITRELAPGSVEVRLRGRDPNFVVTTPHLEAVGLAAVEQAETVATAPGRTDQRTHARTT